MRFSWSGGGVERQGAAQGQMCEGILRQGLTAGRGSEREETAASNPTLMAHQCGLGQVTSPLESAFPIYGLRVLAQEVLRGFAI